MSDIAIKSESVIKLEPEMMRLPNAFEYLKEERDTDGEDSVLASSSDETSTDTGSNLNVTCTPLLLPVSHEDSGHEGSPDNPAKSGKNTSGIRVEESISKGAGRDFSLSKEKPDESDEVCIIEERICERHWRNGKGRVAGTCCSWHFKCSICGTSFLRRCDFLQHVQEHMAGRQTDHWQLYVKRSRFNRSVRPSLTTEAARKEPAERTAPMSPGRLQSRTKVVVEKRKRGRCRSVHLDDEGDAEIVETDGGIAPEPPVPPRRNVAEDKLGNPPAGQGTKENLGERKLLLLIERLPSVFLRNAGITIQRSAESEKTSDHVLGKEQPQSHADKRRPYPRRPSRKPHAKCGSLCGNMDAVNEVTPKTQLSGTGGRNLKKRPSTKCTTSNVESGKKQQQPQKQVVVRTRIFRKPLASGGAPNKEVEKIVSNPQSNKDPHADSVTLQKARTLECATAIPEADKEMSTPNPQSQVQVDVRRPTLRKSQAERTVSNRTESMKNVSSKTTLQSNEPPEGRSSQKELAAKGLSRNVEANEKVTTKTPDQSHAHNTSGKHTLPQAHKGNSDASTSSGIQENIWPRLIVRVEPQATLDFVQSQAKSNLKSSTNKEVSKTQAQSPTIANGPESTIVKPQSPFSSNVETRKRGQRARQAESDGIAEGITASVDTGSAAQLQSQTQKLRAFRKPRSLGTASNQMAVGQAPLNTRFQSRRRTLENLQLEQVVTEERPPQKHPSDSCSFTNAERQEEPLASALIESDTSKRTFPDQTSHVGGSGEAKDEASSKKSLQFRAERVGALATRKRRAGGSRNGELPKMDDAKKRACPVPSTKSDVNSKKDADNEEVPPKIHRKSRARFASRSQKFQTCCNPAPSTADSQAKPIGTADESHMQPGATAHVVSARKSHATEGGKEAADRLTTPKTRLQSHMHADVANGTFRCSYCKATFPDVESLRPHVESHRYWEETFHCELCQRRFSTRGYLAMHMSAHRRDKPFACDLCDRRFALRNYLAMHMRGHAQAAAEKPFGCCECGARFVRAHWLNAHLRAHKRVRASTAGGGNRPGKTQ
ncbi:hypothetical protein R5R35_001127 [Gryllus longicercus]|uniref:C2H2-type domain-containing protein n=1 Tax=Gryllus longicercus TaxID=2509291 RepID=A0AAN9VS44_9ORTH